MELMTNLIPLLCLVPLSPASIVVSPANLVGNLHTTSFSYIDDLTPRSNVTAEAVLGDVRDCFDPQFNATRFQGRAALLLNPGVQLMTPHEFRIAECFGSAHDTTIESSRIIRQPRL